MTSDSFLIKFDFLARAGSLPLYEDIVQLNEFKDFSERRVAISEALRDIVFELDRSSQNHELAHSNHCTSKKSQRQINDHVQNVIFSNYQHYASNPFISIEAVMAIRKMNLKTETRILRYYYDTIINTYSMKRPSKKSSGIVNCTDLDFTFLYISHKWFDKGDPVGQNPNKFELLDKIISSLDWEQSEYANLYVWVDFACLNSKLGFQPPVLNDLLNKIDTVPLIHSHFDNAVIFAQSFLCYYECVYNGLNMILNILMNHKGMSHISRLSKSILQSDEAYKLHPEILDAINSKGIFKELSHREAYFLINMIKSVITKLEVFDFSELTDINSSDSIQLKDEMNSMVTKFTIATSCLLRSTPCLSRVATPEIKVLIGYYLHCLLGFVLDQDFSSSNTNDFNSNHLDYSKLQSVISNINVKGYVDCNFDYINYVNDHLTKMVHRETQNNKITIIDSYSFS